MLKTKIYKCYNCGSIFVTTATVLKPSCIKCKSVMKELQDDFDLAEIVEEDESEQ